MRDATNNLVEVNNVGSSFTTQLDRQLGCRRCVDSLGVETLGLTYSYTRPFAGPGHLPVRRSPIFYDDRQFSIGARHFRVPHHA